MKQKKGKTKPSLKQPKVLVSKVSFEAFRRYLTIYLNSKYQPDFSSEALEEQEQMILAMLSQFGFPAKIDNEYLFGILLGHYDSYHMERSWEEKEARRKHVIEKQRENLKYQQLRMLYLKYLKQSATYEDVYREFQNYFYPILDVYSERLSKYDVLSLTRTVVMEGEER